MGYDRYAQDWHLLQARQQNNLAHRFLEKPAMQRLIPNKQRAEVLLLGCGSAEEIETLRASDLEIASLRGIDKSAVLIDYAKLNYPEYDFTAQSLEEWAPEQQYDFIYSSLTFHYVADWSQLFTKLREALKLSGELLFSVQHPVKWGSATTRSKAANKFILGYEKQKTTAGFTVWGDYLTAREIHDTLFGKIPITHYHKPISEMINIFIRSGFEIVQMVEPLPSLESKQSHPDFYETYSKIPLFVLFQLRKKLTS